MVFLQTAPLLAGNAASTSRLPQPSSRPPNGAGSDRSDDCRGRTRGCARRIRRREIPPPANRRALAPPERIPVWEPLDILPIGAGAYQEVYETLRRTGVGTDGDWRILFLRATPLQIEHENHKFVDLEVAGPCSDDDLALIERLAQTEGADRVIARRRGAEIGNAPENQEAS